MKTKDNVMIEKLERLAELYHQQWESGYSSLCRDFDSRAVPTQPATELEVSEEFVALSKEVASYYEPLIESLAAAGVLTMNIIEPCEGCGVFEVGSVLDQRKSYFNEGKIVLLADEEQVNEGRKLKAEFTKVEQVLERLAIKGFAGCARKTPGLFYEPNLLMTLPENRTVQAARLETLNLAGFTREEWETIGQQFQSRSNDYSYSSGYPGSFKLHAPPGYLSNFKLDTPVLGLHAAMSGKKLVVILSVELSEKRSATP